jgi:hypothetical protein
MRPMTFGSAASRSMRSYMDPWTWLRSVAHADGLKQIDDAWPRLALVKRELLTVCRHADHDAELKKLVAASGRSRHRARG